MAGDYRHAQDGRFLLGNPGGPGRPRRAIEADDLAALPAVVTVEAWPAIVAKAVEQARDGDAKARTWLGAYLAGLPTGDALLKLAAAEQAGYDAVEDEADDLGRRTVFLALCRGQRAAAEGED